jgi:hypothetical protein
MVAISQFLECIEVAGFSANVDWNDGASFFRDPSFNVVWIDVEAAR